MATLIDQYAIRCCRSCLLLSLSILFACCGTAFPPRTLADLPSPDQLPSPACSSNYSANISSFLRSHADNVTFPADRPDDRSFIFFHQLYMHLNDSVTASSFILTAASHSQKLIAPPSLAFLILQPPPSPEADNYYLVELCFTCSSSYVHSVCNNLPIHMGTHTSTQAELEGNFFKDELSLQYNASSGELEVVATQYQQHEEITISFNLTTQYNEILLVGYIIDKEATIFNSEPPSTTPQIDVVASSPSTKKDSMRLVWILVGTILGATLVVVVLTILVLFVAKRNGRQQHRMKASSSLARRGATPIPRSLQHDPEASERPIVRSPPLTPPHYNAFQVNSGTASWLKQPNPR